MRKLLVTGASGLLGERICKDAAKTWDVVGVYAANVPGALNGVKFVRLDLTDFRELKELLADQRPAAVIHAAAVSDPGVCERDPTSTRRINLEATANLAGLCADRNIPFVFTSTDLVFEGLRAPYREEDPVNPISRYGEQKALAEVAVLERYPAGLVCRMPLMFGLKAGRAGGALRGLLDVPAPRAVRLFTDEFRTPSSTAAGASGLLLALGKARGLLHLGGGKRISRYDFGALAVRVFDLRDVTLSPALQRDASLSPRRPPDVSLDCERARALGYQALSLEEQLFEIRREWTGRELDA